MSDRFAKVNGINICYSIQGEGHPLILSHGYGAKKEIWKAQYELAKHFKLITYDIRGLGKSDRPDMPYTMEMLAEDVIGLMDYLDLDKAYIGGRSLGGMISQNVYFNNPKRVMKLILITTNAGMPDQEGVELLKNNIINQLQEFKKNPEEAFFKQARLFYHHSFRKEMERVPNKKFYGAFSAKNLIQEKLKNMPRPQDLAHIAEAIKTHNTRAKLSQIKCPTLLIAGSHDRLTPKTSMELMHHEILDSRLEIIQRAGHYLTLSKAPKVNQIILNFLKQ